MRLLFVEDDPDIFGTFLEKLPEKGHEYNIKDFESAKDELTEAPPDIVILDLIAGPVSPEPDVPGVEIFESIWDHKFCPVIIHSANPGALPEKYRKHPFVIAIQKDSKSIPKIEAAIDELSIHVEALYEAEQFIREQCVLALRDAAPLAFKVFTDTKERIDAVKRYGRRRLAAFMDDIDVQGGRLASWEMYLCPPVSENTKLGDILMKSDGSPEDASSFRIVLTPSCDMVSSATREPVANALVACCVSNKEGLKLIGHGTTGAKKLKERLPRDVLSQGYCQSIIPLPKVEGEIPSMFANLRKLELIPLDKISKKGGGKLYFRIASIDSPFRELISWAYMQNAGRPGLPERDFETWCDEIIEHII